MTEVLNEAPDDAEEVFIAWLKPLRRTANTRPSGAPLPFTLVTLVAGDEVDGYLDAVVSVSTLCRESLGEDNANDESKLTHQRIMLLSRYLEDVVLFDGRKATIDYVTCTETPRWAPYGDDQILRKVGRYGIGLAYVSVAAGS